MNQVELKVVVPMMLDHDDNPYDELDHPYAAYRSHYQRSQIHVFHASTSLYVGTR